MGPAAETARCIQPSKRELLKTVHTAFPYRTRMATSQQQWRVSVLCLMQSIAKEDRCPIGQAL